MTCSMRWFGSGYSDSNQVWCGQGFHECVGHKYSCCSDVYASPVELTISILCPVAMILSMTMLGFVIYKAVSVVREDRDIQVTKNKIAPLVN